MKIGLRHLTSRRPLDFAALFVFPYCILNAEHFKENCDVTY